ncbi:hypothetical protein EAI26_07330 [Lactobacillus sp. 0.1XD8-4]|nr:hypothetical protein [Lactobacillus sp. 0.1XD8-4]
MKHLLLTIKKSITQIGVLIGLPNTAYFTSLFKQSWG